MPECRAVPAPPPRPTLAVRATQWLALAVTALLCLQWPLRDVVGAGSLLANDAAQCLFALYVSTAVAHAARRGEHIVAHPLARGGPRWRQATGALVPLPWCAWLLATSVRPVWASVASLESFPESFNPGYFLVKVGLIVLAATLGWESLREGHAALRRAR
jgi:TRAP-type C4-dicarboxylate transport system permease small subunit